jgi:hypothetical protein
MRAWYTRTGIYRICCLCKILLRFRDAVLLEQLYNFRCSLLLLRFV